MGTDRKKERKRRKKREGGGEGGERKGEGKREVCGGFKPKFQTKFSSFANLHLKFRHPYVKWLATRTGHAGRFVRGNDVRMAFTFKRNLHPATVCTGALCACVTARACRPQQQYTAIPITVYCAAALGVTCKERNLRTTIAHGRELQVVAHGMLLCGRELCAL